MHVDKSPSDLHLHSCPVGAGESSTHLIRGLGRTCTHVYIFRDRRATPMHTKKRTTRQHDRRCLVDTREPKNHVRKIMKQVISIVRIMARLTYAILGPGHFLLRIMQLHCNYIAISWKVYVPWLKLPGNYYFFFLIYRCTIFCTY